jgi:hypothetical protein
MPEKVIEFVYVEMTQPQGDADFGKMAKGRVYRMPAAQAERFVRVGVAKQSSEAAFKKQSEARAQRVELQRTRSGEFAALNEEGAAFWDVSTTRDVTMAPEEGIRKAFEQGRLVNTDRLTDEDGEPLPADANLEQILEARSRLGYGEAPYTEHERSSVQGGGSHTHPVSGPVPNEGSTLHGVAPLSASSQKLTPAQLGNRAASDSDDEADEKPRVSRRSK